MLPYQLICSFSLWGQNVYTLRKAPTLFIILCLWLKHFMPELCLLTYGGKYCCSVHVIHKCVLKNARVHRGFPVSAAGHVQRLYTKKVLDLSSWIRSLLNVKHYLTEVFLTLGHWLFFINNQLYSQDYVTVVKIIFSRALIHWQAFFPLSIISSCISCLNEKLGPWSLEISNVTIGFSGTKPKAIFNTGKKKSSSIPIKS